MSLHDRDLLQRRVERVAAAEENGFALSDGSHRVELPRTGHSEVCVRSEQLRSARDYLPGECSRVENPHVVQVFETGPAEHEHFGVGDCNGRVAGPRWRGLAGLAGFHFCERTGFGVQDEHIPELLPILRSTAPQENPIDEPRLLLPEFDCGVVGAGF